MLATAVALPGCGSDPGGGEAAQFALAEGRAECRRFTTCVPENPCHTGWVTGCRGGEAVCTDIGGWLDNGAACGAEAVCYMGQCVACSAGDACPIPDMYGNPDPCRAGAIACGTGQPVCEYVGPAPDGTPCGPSGETCTGGTCTRPSGEHLSVRTASGAQMDMTGTAWSQCYANEPSPGMSRLGTDTFGPGTFTHTDVVFTSALNCTGSSDPALGLVATGQTLSYGDRVVGWDEGAPSGLPPSVTATAVLLYGFDVEGIPSSLKTLMFVNDVAAPATLHEGDKETIAPDGFPARLKTWGRPRAGACTQGAPCQGTGSACRTWATDCSTGTAVCAEQGTAYDGTSCGPAGEVCVSGTCSGTAAAPVVVRTASGGTVDLTGTVWTTCHAGEPEPSASRWTSDVYGTGTITHREEVYVASYDCTGATDPARSWSVTAAIETAGDRHVGWTNGTPPVWGLPATVLATGVVISGVDPQTGTAFSFADLRFLDDLHWPRALYQGNNDGPLDPEGFPAQLANEPGFEPGATGRTVTGSRTITFWPESGPTGPYVATMAGVSALVPDGTGGYDTYPGTVGSDGTFSVPGVPEGAYVLRLDSGGTVYLAETDASAVDMGIDILGRPGIRWASNVPLELSVTGLEPWASGDLFEAYSANAAVAMLPFGAASIPADATEAIATTMIAVTPLPDAAQGDVVRVFQAKSAALGPTASYVAASSAGFVADATLTATGPNAWSAALAPIPERGAFSSSWPAPLYEAHLAQMGPGAAVQNHKIGVTAAAHAEPFVPPFMGVYMGTAGPALLVARAGAGFGGMDLLDLPYGRFLPAPWTEYRDVRMSARVALTVGGTTVVVRPSIGRVEPLATAPFDAAPLVSPPLDIQVNGLPATVNLAGVGSGPTISWSAPAVGTPTSYLVRVQALPSFALAVSARTAGTSLRIPDGVLAPGSTYFVQVTARFAPAERLDAPLRNEFGGALAEAVTAPFTP